MSLSMSRRQALLGAAALPSAASAARAAAPMQGAVGARANRFKLGGFEVSALLAGTRTVEGPQNIFGMNVEAEEFSAVSADNLIPDDRAQFFFTPTVVNTGEQLILFDTGLNAGGITGALAAAGYSPDQVDLVVLTHMHGDHIGGLTGDAGVTFANASYFTAAKEYDFWAAAGNERFDQKVKPLAEKMRFIGDGDAVASGITAVATHGHTPGHTGYMLESNGAQLMLIADAANHYVWSLAYPDWEVKFDRDKEAAAATRRKLFGMLAADKVPFIGYHMPWPAMGYAKTRGDGFEYVPASYQMLLDG